MPQNETLTTALYLIGLEVPFEIHIPSRKPYRVEPTGRGTGTAHRMLANHPELKIVALSSRPVRSLHRRAA
jgi:hypothetical protein